MTLISRSRWLHRAFVWSWLFLGTASGAPSASSSKNGTSLSLRDASPVAAALLSQAPRGADNEPVLELSAKQKRDIMKANFEKMQRDADELAALAKSLQEDLSKANQNVLSLGVVEKAEKIEKLAKKIKSEAKGF